MRVIFIKIALKRTNRCVASPVLAKSPPLGQSGPLHPTASPHTRPCFAKVGPRHDETPFQFYEAPFRKFETAPRFSYGLQKRVRTKARNTSLGIFVFLYYQTMKLCIFILHGQIIKDF